jgi:phosphate-selective porin OprO/OprP
MGKWGSSFVLIVGAFLVFCLSAPVYGEEAPKTTVDKLLDILQDKGIITGEQYRDLKNELGAEKKVIEEQKKVIEDQKKVVADAKSREEKMPHVGYKNGFYLETPDQNFSLKIGGRVDADMRFYNSDHPENNQFFVNRARIYLSGTLFKYYEFKIEPDFGKGTSELKDGFINVNYVPYAQFKVGQFKEPFSLERLASSNYMDFVERSLPVDNLTPDRDQGIMIHGSYAPFGLHYGLGIFNGVRANESDVDDHKDVAMRIGLTPFYKQKSILLKGLYVGLSTTYGEQEMTYPDDEDAFWSKGKLETAGDTKFFQFTNGVKHDGSRQRLGTEFAWVVGPLSIKGEWMRLDLDDLKNPAGESHDLSMSGEYISLAYFLTGETQQFDPAQAVFKRTKPNKIFDPKNGTWGGVQLLARYERLGLSDGFFDHGYANPAKYTDCAKGFTLGLNWYLNEMVRVMLNYNHIEFDDYVLEADDDNEDVFLARFHLEF